MPIYSFKCNECNQVVELLQNFQDSNPICNSCDGQNEMKRLISNIGKPKFNGSGFYETDYKTNLKKPLESASGSKDEK